MPCFQGTGSDTVAYAQSAARSNSRQQTAGSRRIGRTPRGWRSVAFRSTGSQPLNAPRSRSLRQPSGIPDPGASIVTTPFELLAAGALALATTAATPAAKPATDATANTAMTPEAVNAAIDTPADSGKGAAILR